jgi:hypothetical protein
MSNYQLRHDTAYAAATALTELVKDKFTPEEHEEFQRQAYEVCKAMIDAFEIQSNREVGRISASRN